MPPIAIVVFGAVGAIAASKWIASEARRINAELDSIKAAVAEAAESPRRLRRDPRTGIYHPH